MADVSICRHSGEGRKSLVVVDPGVRRGDSGGSSPSRRHFGEGRNPRVPVGLGVRRGDGIKRCRL